MSGIQCSYQMGGPNPPAAVLEGGNNSSVESCSHRQQRRSEGQGCLPCAVLQRAMPSAMVQLPRRAGAALQPQPDQQGQRESGRECRKTRVPKQQVVKELSLLFMQ